MPRLAPMPRPTVPAAGHAPSPIDPNYDRYYILDEAGLPVRCYDYTEHTIWVCAEGKGLADKGRTAGIRRRRLDLLLRLGQHEGRQAAHVPYHGQR